MATEKKAAPKKATTPAKAKPAKRDNALCHFGGPRMSYGATTTAHCNKPKVAGKELCADHEAKWKVVAKARAAAKKPATEKAPKSAGTSPKAAGAKTPRVAKNSGGEKRTAKPPVPEMHVAAIPRVRTNAPEQAPHLVQLVAE
jgi:hypothetical protein